MVAAIKWQTKTGGVRPDLRDSLLIRAAQTGNFATAESLIAQGADVNAATKVGTTALMNAAAQGHLAVVQLLMDRGASINKNRSDGFGALTFAVFFGHQEVIRELIGRGADIHVQSRSGTSLEMWAAARGFLDIEELLRTADRQPLEAVPVILKSEGSKPRLSESEAELKVVEMDKDDTMSVIKVMKESTPVELNPLTLATNSQDVEFEERITIQPPEPTAQIIPSEQELSETDLSTATKCAEQSFYVSEWNTQDVDFGEGIRRIFPRQPAVQSTATEKDLDKIELPTSTETRLIEQRSGEWNTRNVDSGEGIRRIGPYDPAEQSTASEDYLGKIDAVPFSPVSALVDRLSSSWKQAAVAGMLVVLLFSTLTLAALKANKARYESIISGARSIETTQLPSSANQSTLVTSQQIESAESSSSGPKAAETRRNESSEAGLPPAVNSPVDESQPLISSAGDSSEGKQRVAKAVSQHSSAPVRASRKSPRWQRDVGTVVDNPNEVTAETNGPAAVTFMSKPSKPQGQRVNAPSDFRPQSTAPLEGSSTKRKVIQWP